jgi:uncharacterized protein YhbP (UPF0306 family)
MGSNPPKVEAPPHVVAYLRERNTLTLATASPAGLPHAATMVYVSDGVALYFCTRPGTTTAHNINENPPVSFAIDEYSADWSKTKGIQGGGECRVLLDPGEINHVVALFQQKFPLLSKAKISNLSFFRITPSALQFIDNETAGGEHVGQALGTPYHRSLAYSVFRGLPRQQIDTVAAKLDTVQVGAGGVIVRQGAPADKFFIIVDGEVEVVREDQQAPEHRVATLRRGQFFGETAILRDVPRTATVRALVPTTLLTMDREAFRGLVAQSLSTTENFDQIIRERWEDLAHGGSEKGPARR